MGDKNARAAEKAIDRDSWGAGKMGEVKTGCPGGCKKMYRIHPSIGLARVGNAGLHGTPNEYFIGAETDSFKAPDRFYTLDATDMTKPPTETLIAKSEHKTVYKHARGDKTKPPDEQGHIRRQAQRFRIFEYRELQANKALKRPAGQWGWVREITSDEAKIEWEVKVANTKATFFKFSGPLMDERRTGVAIEPAEQFVRIKHGHNSKKDLLDRRELKDAGKPIEKLGEILHDEKGRLIFLGGHGEAKGGGYIDDYANNDNWNDDVSDGYIKAKITFPKASKKDPEEVYEIKEDSGAAWVMVGPPDYGPELTCVTSLYDLMLDIATNMPVPSSEEEKVIWRMHGVEDRAKADFEPHFDYDLLRLFEATYQTATVFMPANPAMKHPAVYKLSKNTKLDDKTEPGAEHLRYKIFNTLRPPGEERRRDPKDVIPRPLGGGAGALPPNTVYEDDFNDGDVSSDPEALPPPAGYTDIAGAKKYRWTMPMLWGDSQTTYRNTRFTLTSVQFKSVKQWNAKKFTDTDSANTDFDKIPRSRAITPGGLDRAAMERTIGGPFFPGIEASWLTRSDEIYIEPCRVKIGASITKEILYAAFISTGATKAGTVGPGFFSQQMAQPWQADFWACARDGGPLTTISTRIGWWPSQRPDDVVRADPAVPDPTALRDAKPVLKKKNTVKKSALKSDALDEIKKRPRNVSVTVGGDAPETAPFLVTFKGKDESGNTLTEELVLQGVPGTFEGQQVFAEITEIELSSGSTPNYLNAYVSIGLAADGATPAVVDALEISTIVEGWDRTVTSFDATGTAALAASARQILFEVTGKNPEQAPKTATVKGEQKGKPGTPFEETVKLPRKQGTVTTKAAFTAVTEVVYPPGEIPDVLEGTLAFGLGSVRGKPGRANPTAMEDARSVKSTEEKLMVFKWEGVAELEGYARNITITTSGTDPAQAPKTATISGTDDQGATPTPEVIQIDRKAGTYAGKQLWKTVTEIKLAPGEPPKELKATVAVGFAGGGGLSAERQALEDATAVSPAPRAAVLKAKGLAALAKNPRKIMFTTAGTKPEQAPLNVVVKGKEAGIDTTESVALPRKAGTVSTTSKFELVTDVLFEKGEVPATLEARLSIGFGEFLGDMEPWVQGVGSMDDNARNWYRLGFVHNGREIERDPSL